ncbi:hypothetical protein [Brucella intermedia]|uniref:hypothetical protein n=1 Tax=Brucella intermedia TaxID=94625 RepID=UPI000469DC7F|nr:hypothetical protein [Brucella intermedia]
MASEQEADRITQEYLRRWPDSKRAKSWAGRMVHIQTENGVWRTNGHGYTWAHKPDAWILPFEEAQKCVAHCGREKQATFIAARPAPAATDTGLETVGYAPSEYDMGLDYQQLGISRLYPKSCASGAVAVVTRSQAEELLAAERAEKEKIAAAVKKLEAAWRDHSQKVATLEAKLAAAEQAARAAHETLIEINPSNYNHDDVCQLNDASVEAIFLLADILGETHGKTKEWWDERRAVLGGKPS